MERNYTTKSMDSAIYCAIRNAKRGSLLRMSVCYIRESDWQLITKIFPHVEVFDYIMFLYSIKCSNVQFYKISYENDYNYECSENHSRKN